VYFRTKEEVPLSKLRHAEAEMQFHKERIAAIEKEVKQYSPEILEPRGPEESFAFYKKLEKSEGEKDIDILKDTKENCDA